MNQRDQFILTLSTRSASHDVFLVFFFSSRQNSSVNSADVTIRFRIAVLLHQDVAKQVSRGHSVATLRS